MIDYNLPTMNGLAAPRSPARARRLDSRDPDHQQSEPDAQREAASAGVSIVEKPLLGGALTDAIREMAGSAPGN